VRNLMTKLRVNGARREQAENCQGKIPKLLFTRGQGLVSISCREAGQTAKWIGPTHRLGLGLP